LTATDSSLFLFSAELESRKRTVKNHRLSYTTDSGAFNEHFARIEEFSNEWAALDHLTGVLHFEMMTSCQILTTEQHFTTPKLHSRILTTRYRNESNFNWQVRVLYGQRCWEQLGI